MSIDQAFMRKMQRAEGRIREEIAREQVTHPMQEYQPGSPHLEQLYQQLDEARRWWPGTGMVNT